MDAITRRSTELLALATLSVSAFGASPVVVTGGSNLLPNTAGQQVQILISDSSPAALVGEDLSMQIDSGSGPAGPIFTGVDILTGTIFASDNTGAHGQGIVTGSPTDSHFAFLSTTTNSSTVSDNGLLATVTISTVGVSATSFHLTLIGTINRDSDLVLPDATTLIPANPNTQLSIGAAPTRQWINSGNGIWDWDVDGNWSPFAPYTIGDQANFLGLLTSGSATVNLNGDRTVGTVTFNDSSGSYTLAQGTGGSLLLNNGTSASAITVSAGSHSISAPVAFSALGLSTSIAAGSTLTLSGGLTGAGGLNVSGPGELVLGGTSAVGAVAVNTGKLDLTTSNLIVANGGNIPDQIKQAAALGAWTGTGGITSSAAAAAATTSTATALGYATGAEYTAATGQTTFAGLAFNPTDTLVKYTLAGDANMDGAVTFADFLALQNNYNKAGDWQQGDWNYDGQVTFADFLILQNNYNKTLSLGPIVPGASTSAAPEPGSLMVLVLGAWGLVRRRHERRLAK